jgi:hypothetical protein
MEPSSALREKIYRAYLEFFEVAELKRHWNIFDDIRWEKLDASRNCERKAVCIETFCAEELYLPDVWSLPFTTVRQMVCYGALQEAATYLAYKAQKDKANHDGDKVLEAIFFYVSRDEAAHAGFYRAMIELD